MLFVMRAKKKLRVAVIYGGRSGEHEVSLRSAASVIRHLDRERFEVVPIGIDKDGRWLMNDVGLIESHVGQTIEIPEKSHAVVLPPYSDGGKSELVPLGSSGRSVPDRRAVDVVFPVMHGPLCEDGAIQGLLELADVPYVGAGVLGSAIGMDKDVAKRLAQLAGFEIAPFVAIRKGDWERARGECLARAAKELGIPVFVKPANLGSSVGVHKVKEKGALEAAIEDAFRYDTKVMVERAVDAREIEVSVLENSEYGKPPHVSVPGEIVPHAEFYTYDAKYVDDDGAELVIPAKLDEKQIREAQRIGAGVFVALEAEGMARVDMFLDRKSGKLVFNEINTIPGFTSISMYPKLFEASGISYSELLSRLVDLAVARHERKRALSRSR
jgi:D-alanine-D-alanine ligase